MMRLDSNHTRLIISDDFSSMQTKIYLITLEGMRQFVIGYDGEFLVKQEVAEMENYKADKKIIPLLTIPYFMKDYILESFQNLANENNIRPKDESVMEGKLLATKEHLLDMQNIVKKLLKI